MGASANPASMFSPEKSMSPQLLAEFQGFSPQLLAGLKSVMGSLQGIQGFTPTMSPFEQQFLQGLTSGFNPMQSFSQGMQNIAGIGGPDFLQNISNTLRPALVDRPFEQGSAQLREQAALTGTLNSTGAQSSITDLLAQLNQGLGQATIGAAPGIGQLQLSAAGQQVGLPFQVSQYVGGLGRDIEQQGFQNALALLAGKAGALGQAGQGIGAGLQGIAGGIYQPTSGPSKFENLLQTAAPIAGSVFGGPMGGALASKMVGGGQQAPS